MAEATQFGHDRVAHILADRLLTVPSFQRSYAWETSNVEAFLADIKKAREQGVAYFLGTVVFANNPSGSRQQIVDGQQRLATTAVLLIAIRDALRDFKRDDAAQKIDETYIRGYDLATEQHVERLRMNVDDESDYERLLARTPHEETSSGLFAAYEACRKHILQLAPTAEYYRKLIEITTQLDESVQVLVAVASDLPEAYVIFETLNDRGADLTKADLLKNYLFSQAGEKFEVIQNQWISVTSRFEKAADLVRFIRYEHMSRRGHVTTRSLYRALQEDIGEGALGAQEYITRLQGALPVYEALRDPEADLWCGIDVDTRDAVLGFRRFGFESSIPLLLAAFRKWKTRDAAKLYVKVVGWSFRALFAGKLGGGSAEQAFSQAAIAVADGRAKTQADVRTGLASIFVEDSEFKSLFVNSGSITSARARYVLGQLERAARARANQTVEGMPDWASRTVTIEHIFPRALARTDDEALAFTETLANMALLERSINRQAEDKSFDEKRGAYTRSGFILTSRLAELSSWESGAVKTRAQTLGHLAAIAWPG